MKAKLTQKKMQMIRGGICPIQIPIFILICISTLIAGVKLYHQLKGSVPVNDDYRFMWENLY